MVADSSMWHESYTMREGNEAGSCL